MENDDFGYVSVIGFSFFEPIILLLESLESTRPQTPNEVQTGMRENGYSCSIIVLIVTVLESAINRARFVRKEDCVKNNLIESFRSIIENSEHVEIEENFYDEILEVVSVRNSITHNHIWEAKVDWNEKELYFVSDPKILTGYGDKNYKKVINPETRKTKKLKLNLFPTRIWREDVYKVIKTVYIALCYLEECNQNYFMIKSRHFMYKGNLMPISEIINSLHFFCD